MADATDFIMPRNNFGSSSFAEEVEEDVLFTVFTNSSSAVGDDADAVGSLLLTSAAASQAEQLLDPLALFLVVLASTTAIVGLYFVLEVFRSYYHVYTTCRGDCQDLVVPEFREAGTCLQRCVVCGRACSYACTCVWISMDRQFNEYDPFGEKEHMNQTRSTSGNRSLLDVVANRLADPTGGQRLSATWQTGGKKPSRSSDAQGRREGLPDIPELPQTSVEWSRIRGGNYEGVQGGQLDKHTLHRGRAVSADNHTPLQRARAVSSLQSVKQKPRASTSSRLAQLAAERSRPMKNSADQNKEAGRKLEKRFPHPPSILRIKGESEMPGESSDQQSEMSLPRFQQMQQHQSEMSLPSIRFQQMQQPQSEISSPSMNRLQQMQNQQTQQPEMSLPSMNRLQQMQNHQPELSLPSVRFQQGDHGLTDCTPRATVQNDVASNTSFFHRILHKMRWSVVTVSNDDEESEADGGAGERGGRGGAVLYDTPSMPQSFYLGSTINGTADMSTMVSEQSLAVIEGEGAQYEDYVAVTGRGDGSHSEQSGVVIGREGGAYNDQHVVIGGGGVERGGAHSEQSEPVIGTGAGTSETRPTTTTTRRGMTHSTAKPSHTLRTVVADNPTPRNVRGKLKRSDHFRNRRHGGSNSSWNSVPSDISHNDPTNYRANTETESAQVTKDATADTRNTQIGTESDKSPEKGRRRRFYFKKGKIRKVIRTNTDFTNTVADDAVPDRHNCQRGTMTHPETSTSNCDDSRSFETIAKTKGKNRKSLFVFAKKNRAAEDTDGSTSAADDDLDAFHTADTCQADSEACSLANSVDSLAERVKRYTEWKRQNKFLTAFDGTSASWKVSAERNGSSFSPPTAHRSSLQEPAAGTNVKAQTGQPEPNRKLTMCEPFPVSGREGGECHHQPRCSESKLQLQRKVYSKDSTQPALSCDEGREILEQIYDLVNVRDVQDCALGNEYQELMRHDRRGSEDGDRCWTRDGERTTTGEVLQNGFPIVQNATEANQTLRIQQGSAPNGVHVPRRISPNTAGPKTSVCVHKPSLKRNTQKADVPKKVEPSDMITDGSPASLQSVVHDTYGLRLSPQDRCSASLRNVVQDMHSPLSQQDQSPACLPQVVQDIHSPRLSPQDRDPACLPNFVQENPRQSPQDGIPNVTKIEDVRTHLPPARSLQFKDSLNTSPQNRSPASLPKVVQDTCIYIPLRSQARSPDMTKIEDVRTYLPPVRSIEFKDSLAASGMSGLQLPSRLSQGVDVLDGVVFHDTVTMRRSFMAVGPDE